ncbi:MAG TPA: DEAD/DEAH box helicase [Bacilli bacterium]|nr:DEAD/DEAH box helicase [Bacilli bacterium]
MKVDFESLNLNKKIIDAIDKLGFKEPTSIQRELIPVILEGYDIIGQAQTGTGKTLAYAASILSKIDVTSNVVKAIILTPTRELALQVCEDMEAINKSKDFDILAVYGGSSIETQIKSLRKGVDIVVGTPGRVMDLMRRKVLNIDALEFFILDEADEMLNMGFLEDIESIFKNTNKNKQVLLLSATMPKEIKKLAENYMRKDYKHIEIKAETKTSTHVKEYYYLVSEKTRNEVLCRVLDLKDNKRTIIFCQTKRDCDDLLKDLSIRNYSAEVMHGDIEQKMRIQTLDRFKSDAFKVLIATDVAARGIHVDNIDLVINYNLPQEFEAYIHRIGRTGRANEYGEAVSLVSNREMSFFNNLIKFTKSNVEKCEVPTKEIIIKSKYANVMEEVHSTINDKSYMEAIEYVRDFNKDELLKVAASLLKNSVNKELGSNFDKDLTIKETKSKRSLDGYTRVFLTIGKLDKIKMGSLLDFMKETTGINKDCFKDIEILTKFTFLNVADNEVKSFIKKISNEKLNDRVIRAEIAKKAK